MAHFPGFALPKPTNTVHLLVEAQIFCKDQLSSASDELSSSVIFSLGSQFAVYVDCKANSFIIRWSDRLLHFPLNKDQLELRNAIAVSLQRFGKQDEISLHINSSKIEHFLPKRKSLDFSPNMHSLLEDGVTIGATERGNVRADLYNFLISTSETRDKCPDILPTAILNDIKPSPVFNITVDLKIIPSNKVSVGEIVKCRVTAKVTGSQRIRVRLTAFGVPPESCRDQECGDTIFESLFQKKALIYYASVRYPLPGRWIIRAEVTDGMGNLSAQDIYVYVYKLRDIKRDAQCCRSTPFIVAQQLGRPLHRNIFREGNVMRIAGSVLGWEKSYLETIDVESERLFDYSILAPPAPGNEILILKTWSCSDLFVAGIDSPRVRPPNWIALSDVSGHNKDVVFVPLAFPWANKTDILCEEHWLDSVASSKYEQKYENRSRSACLGCSRDSVQRFIDQTNMYDQFNQAIIQSSFGALSLHPFPRVSACRWPTSCSLVSAFICSYHAYFLKLCHTYFQVLPSVEVPFEGLIETSSAEQYYDASARIAISSQLSKSPWLHIVLTPIAKHKKPRFRAWSYGISSKSFTITRCYATM